MRCPTSPVSFLLFSLLLLSACTLDTEYFKDYKDVNLIANRPLSLTGTYGDGSHWWVTETDPDRNPSTPNDPYMNFEAVTDPGPDTISSAVPAGTPVYRLEIKNLIPNGDFEDPLGPEWEVQPAGAPTDTYRLEIQSSSIVPTVDDSNIHNWFTPISEGNKSLWVGTDLGLQVLFDLASAAPDLNDQYALRFRFRSYSNMVFQVGTQTDFDQTNISFQDFGQSGEDRTLPVASQVPGEKKSAWYTVGSGYQLFFDGGNVDKNIPNNLVIDDFQMVNVSKPNWLSLSIPTLEDTVKPLLEGALYTFSLWVRDESSADLSPNTKNAYQAQVVTLKIQYVDKQAVEATAATGAPITSKEYSISFPRPEGGWSDWTELKVDLGSLGLTLNFPDAYTPRPQDPPVLRFQLCPSDPANELWTNTCGRLLISYPSFVFREKF